MRVLYLVVAIITIVIMIAGEDLFAGGFDRFAREYKQAHTRSFLRPDQRIVSATITMPANPAMDKLFSAVFELPREYPVDMFRINRREQFNLTAVLIGGLTHEPNEAICTISHRGAKWKFNSIIQLRFDTDLLGYVTINCNFIARVGILLL